jgi:plastocyanin
VKRGYNLYEANCARCHGEQGQGGIGPVLNDQGKLLAHLTPQYLMNVLTVGGRYICGDSKSLMGVWADTNGGPLNYREIEELIDWLRATTGDVVEVRDPKTGEMIEVTGWRDVAYAPAPGATPVPACWKDAFAVSPTPTGSATPMPSGGMGETYQISAVNPIAFEQTSFETAAGVPFTIVFSNNNVGVPHNVAIHVGTATGTEVFKGEIFAGIGTRTYNVPALTAGTYAFICTVHPNMAGTLTVK